MKTLAELNVGLNNLSAMTLELCRSMGIDVPSLLRRIEDEQAADDSGDY